MFTWQRVENLKCRHTKLSDPVATKPNGAKLVVCDNCHILKRKPTTGTYHRWTCNETS
jgi:hypothetical protein